MWSDPVSSAKTPWKFRRQQTAVGEPTRLFSFRALRGSSNRCSKGFFDSARFQAGVHVLVYGRADIDVFAIQLTRFRGEHVPVIDCAYDC